MHSTTVIAYADTAWSEVLCVPHGEARFAAIQANNPGIDMDDAQFYPEFAGTEVDSEVYCGECGLEIEGYTVLPVYDENPLDFIHDADEEEYF